MGIKPPTKLLLCCEGCLFLSSQDCLQEIQDFLKKHMDFVFSLLGIAIGFTVTMSVLSHFGSERQDPVRKKYPKLPPEARILGDSGGWQQRNKQWWIPSWKSGKGQEPGRADRWRGFPAGIASLHRFVPKQGMAAGSRMHQHLHFIHSGLPT